MGAQQSSSRDEEPASAAKTCYYELLGVERDASEDEIKRAYKKKALLLHPDRNYGDVENATRRFAEVQSAYEVLSDPQERAWYDSHRDAILRGADSDGINNLSPEFNSIKLTSTEDILSLIRRFNAAVPFTDEPVGFFGIASETFARLADEELAAGQYDPDDEPVYPFFGESTDSYDPVVKAFYAGWASFSTRKTFPWKDKYNLGEAPDRRVRRLMEKENKKLRDDAIREFNDAVRFLVTFVRKRDPRYLPNQQTDAERQAALRSAAAAQAARSRAANLKKLNDEPVSIWAQIHNHGEDGSDHFFESEEESEVEQIECVVCDKTFKSERSFEAHAKSKKHIKAVQQLRRQMRKEGADLDIDEPAGDAWGSVNKSVVSPAVVDGDKEATEDNHIEPQLDALQLSAPSSSTTRVEGVEQSGGSPAYSGDDDDDEYAPRAEVEQRIVSADHNITHAQGGDDPTPQLEDLPRSVGNSAGSQPEKTRKMGMAKEKRAKKAARGAHLQGNTCDVCHATFPSKTKLFNHIRELGHAALRTVPTTPSKGTDRGSC